MGAGSLRARVTFQRRFEIDDGAGNPVSGPWVTVCTVAAAFTPLRGGEEVMASRLAGVQPFVVRVRQSSLTRPVTTDWRIVDARNGERVFNIRTKSDPDERRTWFDMIVTEGVAT